MSEYALRLVNAADTAARVRMADVLGLQPNGQLQSRSGLRRASGGAVSVNAGTMQVQVSPFAAWVDGGSSVAQGGYPFVLDATKTLTLADGDASLARVDTIAVVIHEDAFDGSGLTDAGVVVVTGTPGAGSPALPATCLPLRDVNIPAGTSTGTGGLASGNLSTDRRTWLPVGVQPVASSTERDALTVENGQVAYRVDSDNLEVRKVAGWRKVLVAGGDGTVAAPAGQTVSLKAGSAALTFNAAGEATLTHNLGVAPTAVFANHLTGGANILVYPKAGTLGVNTCTLVARKDDGTAYVGSLSAVLWLALVQAAA